MKKSIVRLFLLIGMMVFISNQNLKAQDVSNNYSTAIGAKFYPTGITLKHFVSYANAFEFIGYFYERGSRLTALYEYHGEIGNPGGLRWYVGPGAHVAFYKTGFFQGSRTVGVDGVLGLDYKFKGIPINISADWQPSYEFGDYDGFSGGWGGFAVRFTF
ncbi:MAG: hypothetical protein KA767_08785 [Saprospiraceae bacterium]|nr:hypothetical protein [Saprospiraceae bacterium]HMS67747.1 hypothetical protein [Saprospiraceae bacterium]